MTNNDFAWTAAYVPTGYDDTVTALLADTVLEKIAFDSLTDDIRLEERDVSVSRLHELFELDHATGQLFRRVTTSSRAQFGDEAGSRNAGGYLNVWLDGRFFYAHRIAFALVHGRWPVGVIDHKDGNPENNRPENLREASHAQNRRNAALYSNNGSGVPGVFRQAKTGRWVATITFDGCTRYLGSFPAFADAVAARHAAEDTHFGSFAARHSRPDWALPANDGN